jgi:H+-translocating NAD(P) transhydrogenase subunit alpha
MGATFINLELEALEGAGGYAREMTEERAAKQRELLTPFIAKSHVVITTAAVPGRTAPRLMTAAMVDAMEAGTIIVDLSCRNWRKR